MFLRLDMSKSEKVYLSLQMNQCQLTRSIDTIIGTARIQKFMGIEIKTQIIRFRRDHRRFSLNFIQ